MKPETINSTDLRLQTRDLMERVKFKGERFIVETFGRPMAVIISWEDFTLMQDMLVIRPMPTAHRARNTTPKKSRSKIRTAVRLKTKSKGAEKKSASPNDIVSAESVETQNMSLQ